MGNCFPGLERHMLSLTQNELALEGAIRAELFRIVIGKMFLAVSAAVGIVMKKAH